MRNQTCLLLLFLGLGSAGYGQQPKTLTAAVKAPESANPAGVPIGGAEVLEFERKLEAAIVRGAAGYVDRVSAEDLIFTHGDGWTSGGKPLLVDDKKSFLKRVENRQYNVRDLDSVRVEMHGDIAITYGRYVAQNRLGDPAKSWFSVWFERVYEKRGGQWLYVSHKTVHGPTYGPDRQSVADK